MDARKCGNDDTACSNCALKTDFSFEVQGCAELTHRVLIDGLFRTFRTVQLNSHRLKTVPPCLPAGLGSKYGDRRVSVNNCTKRVFPYGLQSSTVRILNSVNISLVYCLSCKKPWREDKLLQL